MNKTPAEIDALLEKWSNDSAMCSFWHMMIKRDGYQELLDIGQPVIPRILRLISKGEIWIGYLQLLCVITKEQPGYKPEKIGGFSAFNVEDFAKSWLEWAKTKGVEIPSD